MIDNMNLQGVADILKGIVLDTQAPKAERMQALDAIKKFERCSWRRVAMVEALNDAGVQITETGLIFGGDSSQVLKAIEASISHYMEAVGCKGEIFDEIYTIEDAATYLGISIAQMQTYVSRQKRIRGRVIGMAFTREQLDKFKEEKREPGNPNFGKKS